MTDTDDLVRIDFPWHALRQRGDGQGVAVVMPRHRLVELRNFLWALEAGLVESDAEPAGRG